MTNHQNHLTFVSFLFVILFSTTVAVVTTKVPIIRRDIPINDSNRCLCQPNKPVALENYIGCGLTSPQFHQNCIFFTDMINSRVRYLDRSTNKIFTIAGSGSSSELADETLTIFCRSPGFEGDNGLAFVSKLNRNEHLTIDRRDNAIIIMDTLNNRIRRVLQGIIKTIVGNGNIGKSNNGTLAKEALVTNPRKGAFIGGELHYQDDNGLFQIKDGRIYQVFEHAQQFSYARYIKILTFEPSPSGAIYVSLMIDDWNFIKRFEKDGTWTHIMGTQKREIDKRDNVLATNSTLYLVREMVVAEDGILYFIDSLEIDIQDHPFAELSYLKRIELDGTVTNMMKSDAGCVFGGIGIDTDGNTLFYTVNNQFNNDMKQARLLSFSCPTGHVFSNDKRDCVPTCNSVSAESSHVCNGHGNCTDVDTCMCHTNYSPEKFCERPFCFDDTTQRGGCSNHGQCVSPDTCACDTGYGGYRCQFFQCNAILSNSSNVCSGHGTCIGVDYCQCDRPNDMIAYKGNDCELSQCRGIWSNDHNVCNGHGNCLDFDHCQCHDGYSGENCETNQGLAIPLGTIILMIVLFVTVAIVIAVLIRKHLKNRKQFKAVEMELKLTKAELIDFQKKMIIPYQNLEFKGKNTIPLEDLQVFIKKIENPNIAQLTKMYDALRFNLSDENKMYFVEIETYVKFPNVMYVRMKWYPEKDLATCEEETKRKLFGTVDNMICFIEKLVKGLQALHGLRIIHRDIKPHNILIDGDNIRFTDFEDSWFLDDINYLVRFFKQFFSSSELPKDLDAYEDLEDQSEGLDGKTEGYTSKKYPNSTLADVFALAETIRRGVIHQHEILNGQEKETSEFYNEMKQILNEMQHPPEDVAVEKHSSELLGKLARKLEEMKERYPKPTTIQEIPEEVMDKHAIDITPLTSLVQRKTTPEQFETVQ